MPVCWEKKYLIMILHSVNEMFISVYRRAKCSFPLYVTPGTSVTISHLCGIPFLETEILLGGEDTRNIVNSYSYHHRNLKVSKGNGHRWVMALMKKGTTLILDKKCITMILF